MRLAVELHDCIIGELVGDARTFDFLASNEGIERFGVNSRALSIAIPLAPAQRRDWAGRRRNWFAELLPEGDQYDYMLAQAGLRGGDTLSFLARYGRDVAGALQIWDLDDPTEPRTPSLRSVNQTEIRALLEDPIGSPLANDRAVGKSSLGGVQPKVVLVQTESGWAQSLGGYPTTHILKPQLEVGKESVIFDEEYGARIARHLGLLKFGVTIQDFDGRAALVIERFDRGVDARVHQEDFNQALGASGNQKYQRFGGVISLQRIANALKKHAADNDLLRLARMTVLAVAIGNLDMHAKNLGLLHPLAADVTLTPAYDVVPQAHLSRDGELALAVNGKYRHVEITQDDLVAEISAWGLRGAAQAVEVMLAELGELVQTEHPLRGAYPDLQDQILEFVKNLREGHPVGGRSALG